MAISENVTISSWIAGTTFGSTQLYKFVVADAQGHVIDAAGGSTNTTPVGVLYGLTQTTTTEAEAVPVATWGTVKVQAAASTLSVGNLVACSTGGLATAPTTDAPIVGICKYGSSGSAGRILSVQLTGFAAEVASKG